MPYIIDSEVLDVLIRLASPGDFAQGQRTLPKKTRLPHGYFARGQVAGENDTALITDE